MSVIAYGTGNYYTGTAASTGAKATPAITGSMFCRVDVWIAGTSASNSPVTCTGSVAGAYTAAGANPQQATSGWTMYTFYKVITAAENVTVSWTGSKVYALFISTRTGINTSTPVDTTVGSTSTGTQISSGAVSPSNVGYTADVVIGMRNSTTGVTWNPAVAQMDRRDAGTSPNRHVFVGFGSPGAGTATFLTFVTSPGPSAAITLVLIPATAALTAPAPRTWTSGFIDADDLNTEIRDPINWLLNPPLIITQLAGNQSISDQTFTAVTFNAETEKTGFTHSNSSVPRQHTVQVNGLYVVMCTLTFVSGTNSGQRRVELYKNGTGDGTGGTLIGSRNQGQPAGGIMSRLSAAGLVRAVAGDFFQAVVYQSSGSALDAQASQSLFSAVFVAK